MSSTKLEDTATVITRTALVLDETQCSTLEVHASTVGRPTQEPDADEEGVGGYVISTSLELAAGWRFVMMPPGHHETLVGPIHTLSTLLTLF